MKQKVNRSTGEVTTIKKTTNPKFRVIPNLSLKGRDIMTRLKNRSLILNASGQYEINEAIDATRRMTKLDILNEMKRNSSKINEIQSILNQAKLTNNATASK